jgi:hypothetical protein
MTYADFKTTVLSYANRSSAVFTSGSLDYVLAAMNDARRAAQREYTFTLNRRTAFAQLSLAPCSLLTDFDTTPASGTLCVVKQVDAIFNYGTANVGATAYYYRTEKVLFQRHSAFDTLQFAPETLGGTPTIVSGVLAQSKQFAYIQGTGLVHSTLTTPTWYLCDVVEWLADHAGDTTQDIFLTYFADWLKYATLMNLNQFLKDGERFPIDSAFVGRLWESVKQYDSQMGASTGAIDLN